MNQSDTDRLQQLLRDDVHLSRRDIFTDWNEFDREDFIRRHQKDRKSFSQLAPWGWSVSWLSVAAPSFPPSAALSTLRKISFSELILDKRHEGRALYGRFCVEPLKMEAVQTVMEDYQGRGIRVTIHNVTFLTDSFEELQRKFPRGARVAIKEPYYKRCPDRFAAVSVDNPADVVVNVDLQHHSEHETDINSQEGLEIVEEWDEFDREDFIRRHQKDRKSLSQLAPWGWSVSWLSVAAPSFPPSAALSTLRKISFPELILDKRHEGRALYGRFCVEPLKMKAVQTVMEDDQGRGIRVTIHNVTFLTDSFEELQRKFPRGARVAIKEPYYKRCPGRFAAVSVDNPADVVVNVDLQHHSKPETDINSQEDLEAIRMEGSRLFGKKDFLGAIDKYSACITWCSKQMKIMAEEQKDVVPEPKSIADQEQGNQFADKSLQLMAVLAYSDRAECWLRLEKHQEAANDAEKALELDGKHAKSLDRKERALRGLRKHEAKLLASLSCFNL